MAAYTAHRDTFVRDHLPSPHEWPELRFTLPELQYPERVNAACVLLDDAIAEGHGDRPALMSLDEVWSYAELRARTDAIAHVLVQELGFEPGNRVLLRGPNTLMLAAAWLAVLKAGGVAVTTMSMLRAGEIVKIATKARVDIAICDARFRADLDEAALQCGRLARRVTFGEGDLERRMASYPMPFAACDTSAEDPALLAFTSGTTGNPKATIHFHRDVLVMADVVARHLLKTCPDDVYVGSPPLGFTFGLGALLVFPLRFRASAVLVESASPDNLMTAIRRRGATCLFTAPVAYRSLLPLVQENDLRSLRRCVSAGEALPRATSDAWHARTGIRIIDGIGATELIHIFISACDDEIRPGATGKPLPGYEARVVDDAGEPVAPNTIGRLAVRGPTGCRYLDDARQGEYVQRGWNITGDTYRVDEDGYFWFQARADDMIVSAGYNIAGPEVEAALIEHAAVLECAVVGAPDEDRGHIVKAFVVLRPGHEPSPELCRALQDFVKQRIAPYKYPRAIEFLQALPKTQTGKVQRFRLRSASLPASHLPASQAETSP